MGLMSAGIVHDLGNTFQIVASAINILKRHPQIEATEALQPILDGAVNSIERGNALIQHVLGFARQNDAPDQDVDLVLCLTALAQPLRWIVKDEIKLDIQVAADMPSVVCNRWNLENALLNLALNARDAMPDGGLLAIIASRCGDDGVAFRVHDTGSGMTPETIARAFEPFFTTKQKKHGNGLGLAMVRHFAEHAGGDVTITSKLELGTIVTLRLPLRPRSKT